MTVAVVRRWLKVPDPTALTAKDTLQRLLGFADVLRDVERSVVFAFRWEGRAPARAILERLARETNVLQNPNKHFLEIAVSSEILHPRGNVWVLTYEAGNGAEIGSVLERRRLVEGEPPQVARGVLWELSGPDDRGTLSRMAAEIAETRERRAGLLANPHLENITICGDAPAAVEMGEAFAWESAQTDRIER
jgi:phosphoribosylformylglycinamidine (FGAM) synthase PurS component